MNTPSPPDFYAGKPFQHGRYSCEQGFADRITLPNGKFAFTGKNSIFSEACRIKHYKVETVTYQGNCAADSIGSRVADEAPVWINGEYVTNKPDLFATDEDLREFNLKL